MWQFFKIERTFLDHEKGCFFKMIYGVALFAVKNLHEIRTAECHRSYLDNGALAPMLSASVQSDYKIGGLVDTLLIPSSPPIVKEPGLRIEILPLLDHAAGQFIWWR